MARIILTVSHPRRGEVRDLEVPGDVESVTLMSLVASALGWDDVNGVGPGAARLEAQPLGRLLEPHESLEDAGVWDGSMLLFHTTGEPSLERRADGPAQTWKPLDVELDLPGQTSSIGKDGTRTPKQLGWKRLDDE